MTLLNSSSDCHLATLGSESTSKKGSYCTGCGGGGGINPVVQGEIGLFLHSEGEEYAWNGGDPLGHPLVLPCPVIKVNRKLQ